MRETCDPTLPDRVANVQHNDRNQRGGLLCRERGLVAATNNDVHAKLNKLCRKGGITLGFSLGKAAFNNDVLAFDEATRAQSIEESLAFGLLGNGWIVSQKTNAIDLARLLPPRHHRPRRCATKPRDELPPS